MSKLDRAKQVIEDNYKQFSSGLFATHNICGDRMTELYWDSEVQVYGCYHWKYFEVFGLTTEEFDELEKFYVALKR